MKDLWCKICAVRYSLLLLVFMPTAVLSMSAFARSGSRNPRTSVRDGGSVFNKDRPSNLVLLQMLFRHGDRSPTHFFPWDTHQFYWPQGAGQLTQIGMQQAYQYGQLLRQKYNDFLPKEYNRTKVEVQSTDVDRTLMTAQCLLAGLFPANSTSWPLSPWQPIPVHTQPDSQNHLFAHAPCPEFDQLDKEYQNTEPFQTFVSKYQPLFDQISSLTKTEVDRNSAHRIADMIFCEAQHNLSRPVWMTDAIFHKLMDLRNETYTQDFVAAGTARLSGGPMLAEMTKNMEQRAKDPTSTTKVFLFSAHDTNIANFGRALGIFNNLQPPYVTSITLELHEQDGNYFVVTLFDNHTANAPFKKTVSGCAPECPLQQFHELLRDNMLPAADRPAACAVSGSSQATKTVIPILAVAVVLVVVVVVFLVYRWKRRRQSQTRGHDGTFQYRQLLQPLSDSEDDDDHIDELSPAEISTKKVY